MTNYSGTRRVKVGLVQINNSFSNQSYLPLSVGMLQAYAQRYLAEPECYEFLLPIYNRISVDEAVRNLQDADVAFFSCYVWNFRISLEVARRLRASNPTVVVVFGGPQVPNNAENFLRQNSFIDLACHGEGEQSALAILENYSTRDWSMVPGISWLGKDSQVVQNNKAPRIDGLSSVPSPYLEGVFNPLIEAQPDENWIALWETNRGCPFSCTFCDWGSATQSKVHSFDMTRLQREVQWFADHKIDFVFCCDANFGILPRDIELATYVAEIKKKCGYPGALSVQNTKNATERAFQVQKILSDAGLNKGVDIALQSIDTNTLKSIKRDNISSETYQELQRRFTRDGVDTYTDLILGLPGETYNSFAEGVSSIISNGQHNRIQFNNLSILPNAEMGDPEYQNAHGMVTVESNTINIHGSLTESPDSLYETQELVIATSAMPKQDWVRARVFSWMTALLHFDKTLQIPLVLVNSLCSVSYRDLIEVFSDGDLTDFPTLASIQEFFVEQAKSIQRGGPEYVRSEDWLSIWWPADEYALIDLCTKGKLAQFYQEAEKVLWNIGQKTQSQLSVQLLHQAIALNQGLLKLPFQTEDLDIKLTHNLWEFYQSVLMGQANPLKQQSSNYLIDRTSSTWASWDDWAREVIWYGNKKGAYLYNNNTIEPQMSGHF